MRLVTYADSDGRPRVGIMHGAVIVDPDRALRAAADMRRRGADEEPHVVPTEMVAFSPPGRAAMISACTH